MREVKKIMISKVLKAGQFCIDVYQYRYYLVDYFIADTML